MGEKKLTVMLIEVDLGCEKCRRKIKKVLCDIPQIQSQVYDEKTNTVMITVYCCCPEKIMRKICCKGGKTVKVIKIKPPEKLKPPPAQPVPSPPKPPPAQPAPSPPKPPPAQPAPSPPKPPPAQPAPSPPKPPPAQPAPSPPKPPPAQPAPSPPKPPPAQPAPSPPVRVPCVPGHHPPPPPPAVHPTCCRECYEGYGGGPCYEGYGRPVPCYEGYGRPVYDSWGGGYGRVCYVRCDYYLCEENPQGCIIM